MNYSEKILDVMNIVNSLTNEELLKICNGNFKNTPYVKYRLSIMFDLIKWRS